MDLALSHQRYQLDIPRGVWQAFFAQLTDERRGHLITLQLGDRQRGDYDLWRHSPLLAIVYDPSDQGRDLVITASRSLDTHAAHPIHRIIQPQTVSIITDEDGIIQSCTVTDDKQVQTIISFPS